MPTVDSLGHPRVLVLSGGGGNGAAQAAAVLELYRRGLQPDLIIGTSIGAWNGAYLSTHPGIAGAERLVELWQEGAFFQMARPRGPQLLKAAMFRDPSLISPRSISRALRRTGIAGHTWADAKVPLIIGAVDAVTLELQYWNSATAKGSLSPQVSSSSALTPLLPFGIIDGREYVDAGMQDNYGIPEVVRYLAAEGKHNAAMIVLDCAPSAQREAGNVARATDVALGAVFRRHRNDGVAMAQAAGHKVELIEVGGDHAISDYMDPKDGVPVGAAAISAWESGRAYYPTWPKASFVQRVANVVSFTVDDIMNRYGMRRPEPPGREIA